MNKVEQILNLIDLDDVDKVLFADGFDDCIIGFDFQSLRVVYCVKSMIIHLISEGMEEEDAIEYLEFNVLSAYVGEHTPIYIHTVDVDEVR